MYLYFFTLESTLCFWCVVNVVTCEHDPPANLGWIGNKSKDRLLAWLILWHEFYERKVYRQALVCSEFDVWRIIQNRMNTKNFTSKKRQQRDEMWDFSSTGMLCREWNPIMPCWNYFHSLVERLSRVTGDDRRNYFEKTELAPLIVTAHRSLLLFPT